MAASLRSWSGDEVFGFLQARFGIAMRLAISWCGVKDAEEAVDEAVVHTTVHAIGGGFANRSEGEVWWYFRRVLSTECRNLRTRSRLLGGAQFEFDESRDAAVSGSSDPSDSAAWEESLRRLQRAIDSLDSELQRVIRSRMEGRTLQSIADAEKAPLSRIYQRERTAHAMLRQKLSEHQAPW